MRQYVYAVLRQYIDITDDDPARAGDHRPGGGAAVRVPRYPARTLNYDPLGPPLNQSGRNQSVDDDDDDDDAASSVS